MQQRSRRTDRPNSRQSQPVPDTSSAPIPHAGRSPSPAVVSGSWSRWWYLLLALLLLVPPVAAIGVAVRWDSLQAATPVPRQVPALAIPRSTPVPEISAGSAHWSATKLTKEIDALLEIPKQPGHLLAGTPEGLWFSSDDGATWQPDRSGLTRSAITSLASATNPDAVFAGDGDGYVSIKPSSSTQWERISPSLGASPVFSLAVNPDSRTVLAGTDTAMFRGTEQGGQWHWQQVLHTHLSSVSTIVWTSWKPREGYAAVFGESPPVYRSSDDGRTWHPASGGLPSQLPSIALIAPSLSQKEIVLTTMGVGVWRSTGNGHWTEISTGLPERHAMPVTIDTAGTLFAGTMGYGAYMKQGTGAWQRVGKEMVGGQYIILSIVTTHGAQPAVLAGTSSGLFRLPLPT